jgi:short-subunit dehydrogenase
LLARNNERLDSLKKEISNDNNHIHYISCDVAEYNQCKAAFDIAKGEFGGIDMAILNAGTGLNSKLDVPHLEFAHKVMDVNYFGVLNFAKVLFPHFINKGKGDFIAVSSLADNRGFEGSGIYCSSKAALSVYLEAARTELEKHNVRVMTIKPGFVDTNMTRQNNHKKPFIMSANKAAGMMYKAIGNGMTNYSFPWQTRLSGYILRILPSGIYNRLARIRGKLGL